jgi:predicted secreted protein
MATLLGKEGTVSVGASDVAEVKSFSIDMSAATVNDTVMGDTWESKRATFNSWTGSLDCFWDPADTAQLALDVGAEVTVKLSPEGSDVTGDVYWTGSCIVTSISLSTAHDGLVEASFSFEGNGALTETTVA